jgi:predicted glycosyltransferase
MPIRRELARRGCEIVMTARDAYQVCSLADHYGLEYRRVGRHLGGGLLFKVAGLFIRAAQLLSFALKTRPHLALSHGSRSQTLLCNLLGIPTVGLDDYEHSTTPLFARPKWEMVPDALVESGYHSPRGRTLTYPGIKEDVYVSRHQMDGDALSDLNLEAKELVVTVRPPASEAHYHNPESERLLEEFMLVARETSGCRVVLLPRNPRQAATLHTRYPEWFDDGRTVVPERALNGLALLCASDLVVSGGGTMNREAAALGIPVYSIFKGQLGAVDRKLEKQGRLTIVRNAGDVRNQIQMRKRDRSTPREIQTSQSLQRIIDHLGEILHEEYPRRFN